MLYFDESNILNTLSILFIKETSVIIRLLTTFNLVLLDLLYQIFILIIHDYSERSYLIIRVISVVMACQKVIIRFF